MADDNSSDKEPRTLWNQLLSFWTGTRTHIQDGTWTRLVLVPYIYRTGPGLK